jgi:hypothetical protein
VLLIVILFIGLCGLFFTEGIDQIRSQQIRSVATKNQKKGNRRLARSPNLRPILWSSASSRRSGGADRPTSERFCGPAPGPSPIFVRLIKKTKKTKGDVHCHYLAQYTPHQNHQKNKTNNTSASPSFSAATRVSAFFLP